MTVVATYQASPTPYFIGASVVVASADHWVSRQMYIQYTVKY